MAQHDFGPPPSSDGGTDTLRQGQILTDANGQRWIAVDTGFGWRLVPEDERTTATVGTKLPPTSTWITETGDLIEVRGSGEIVGSRAVPSSQFFGGGGSSAPAFSSTQAAQTQREEFEAGESALDREAAAERDRLRDENDRRLQLISSLTSLADAASQKQTDLLGLRQSFEVLLAQTQGDDPVRAAILGQGQVQRGRTPAQAQRANLTTLAGQSAAAAAQAGQLVNPNLRADTAGLESQISEIRGVLNQPDPSLPPESPFAPPPVFGLLHGGEVVKAGKDESPVKAFSSRPDPMTAFQFAEQMGLTPLITGEREGGPELVLAAKGTKVIPLDDREEALLVGRVQGAQEGFSEEDHISTLGQALSPIYQNLGLAGPPEAIESPYGISSGFRGGTPFSAHGLNLLNKFGVRPGLIRFGSEDAIFLRDPETDELRHIQSRALFDEGGFHFTDVVNLGDEVRDRFSFGAPITSAPPLSEPGVTARRFPLLTRPWTVDFPVGPSLILPAARQLASIFRNVSKDTRSVILSAFSVGGQPRASFEEEIDFFTPSGTATRAGAATFG